jgi:YidC/Oxa1 family membrane protein insertase
MRRLIALALLLLPALALEAGFKDVDVNGDGVPEKVAVTNLVDLAFDQKGQVVGWYVKTYKGTAIGDYAKAPNLRADGPVVSPAGFTPTKAEFLVEDGRLLARFQGQEGTLTYEIAKGRYTVKVQADFPLALKALRPKGRPRSSWRAEGSPYPVGKARPATWPGRPGPRRATPWWPSPKPP